MPLTARQLDAAFPFHVAFGPDLRIRRVGPSMEKLLGEPAGGRPFGELFEVHRPAGCDDWASMRERMADAFSLRALFRPGLSLRGQMLADETGEQTVFVGSPVFTRAEHIRAHGLSLADFAPHDPIGDFLFLQRGTLMAFEDTRKLAGRLKEKSNRLNAILELSPDGFVAFDGAGHLEFANHALGELLGESPDALYGLTIADFAARLAACCSRPPDPAWFDAGVGDAPDAEFEFVRPAPRDVKATSRVSANGARVFYFRDITPEREVDRMKSEFLSMAAHELRTPMASIYGFIELLLARPYSEERRRDLLQTIHRQSRRLIALVNELLDLARIEARRGRDFEIGAHPLQPLVLQALHDQHAPDTHRIVFDPSEACESAWASIDPEKFRQALGNVLSNAIKYSPQGGEVRVALERDGDRLGVSVRDPGIGMTVEQLEHVFERFWRADKSGNIPGTGLGMSLVKEIVEAMGGDVRLSSQPGEGTTVMLWLHGIAPPAQPDVRPSVQPGVLPSVLPAACARGTAEAEAESTARATARTSAA